MKAAGSFQERQLHPNTGEQLFEEYCKQKGARFIKIGFMLILKRNNSD